SRGFGKGKSLVLAESLERGSEHPLAAAIVSGAEAKSVSLAEAEGFQSSTGKGVTGKVDGRAVGLGNASLLKDLGVDRGAFGERAEPLREDGQTVMFLLVDRKPAGLLGTADPIKASTEEAPALLRKEGLKVVMLTGDSRATAAAVAKKLGLDDVIAEVLPADKVRAVQKLQ